MAKKSKLRLIYESAFDHFEPLFVDGLPQDIWAFSLAFDEFIKKHPYRDYEKLVTTVMSAVYQMQMGNGPDDGSDYSQGGRFFACVFHAGRNYGRRESSM